jgi:hypothetical protein
MVVSLPFSLLSIASYPRISSQSVHSSVGHGGRIYNTSESGFKKLKNYFKHLKNDDRSIWTTVTDTNTTATATATTGRLKKQGPYCRPWN